MRDAYDPWDIRKQVTKKLRKLGWPIDSLVFDLSGGNRMMAFALFGLARDHRRPLIDLEYIRRRHYHLRLFVWEDGRYKQTRDETLPPLITIEDYFQAHVPGIKVDGFSKDSRGRIDEGGRFEKRIYDTLVPHVDEILAGVRPAGVQDQIEIDMVVRCGNAVGIIEAKTGVKKAGIDQLDTAGNPHYLGEHILKFLVTGRYLPRAHKSLAAAQEIRVVELPGYHERTGIPDQEQRRLIDIVRSVLGASTR
jgi:hypothetical protein